MDNGTNTVSLTVSNGSLKNGQWYHLVLTGKIGDKLKAYINGVLFDDVAYNPTLPFTMDNLYVGFAAVNDYLTGFAGYTAIYDHVLTSEERTKLYKEFLDASPITRKVQ